MDPRLDSEPNWYLTLYSYLTGNPSSQMPYVPPRAAISTETTQQVSREFFQTRSHVAPVQPLETSPLLSQPSLQDSEQNLHLTLYSYLTGNPPSQMPYVPSQTSTETTQQLLETSALLSQPSLQPHLDSEQNLHLMPYSYLTGETPSQTPQTLPQAPIETTQQVSCETCESHSFAAVQLPQTGTLRLKTSKKVNQLSERITLKYPFLQENTSGEEGYERWLKNKWEWILAGSVKELSKEQIISRCFGNSITVDYYDKRIAKLLKTLQKAEGDPKKLKNLPRNYDSMRTQDFKILCEYLKALPPPVLSAKKIREPRSLKRRRATTKPLSASAPSKKQASASTKSAPIAHAPRAQKELDLVGQFT